MPRATLVLLALTAVVGCTDPAAPENHFTGSGVEDQVEALAAVLSTSPWRSYAVETGLATAGPLSRLVPEHGDAGRIWSWDPAREGFMPSALPGTPGGVARFVLYPRDSTGAGADHAANPVGFADLRPLGGGNAFGVRVGAGPTRYADYVIAGEDLRRTGTASGVLADPATLAGFSLRYDDSQASVTLTVPGLELAVRLGTRVTATGNHIDILAQTPGGSMRGTGRAKAGVLSLAVSREGRRLGYVELRGDSVSVRPAEERFAAGDRQAAIALARLARFAATLPQDVSAPLTPFQR